MSIRVSFRRIATALPSDLVARSSHAISHHAGSNTTFLFGGEHIARTPIDSTIYALDLAAKEPAWAPVAAKGTAPSLRIAHAQAFVGSGLYVFGGRQGITMEEAPLNDMYRFDVMSSEWTSIPYAADSPSPPSMRSFHRMVALDTSLYVFGGCGAEGRLADLHRFDTTTSRWETMPSHDAIKGRGGACLFANPKTKCLYVVAGFSGEENNDGYMFDTQSKTWTTLTLSPAMRPRSVCAHAFVGDNLLLLGGEVDPSEKGHMGAGAFERDVVLVKDNGAADGNHIVSVTSISPDAAVDAWPCPRGWTSLCELNSTNDFLLFGGLTGSDDAPVRCDDTWIGSIAVN